MAKLLKLRRGTTSQHNTFTGAEGEVTIDTTKDTAVVHDGSTAGGRPLAREDMSNVSSSAIAGRLGADAIATTKIAGGTLPSDVKITDANVSGNLTIANADINADAVNGSKIADNSINSEHYVDGSIDRVHLAGDIVDGSKIADDSINSEHYVDGSIDNAHISTGAVTFNKMQDIGANQILGKVTSGTGDITALTAANVRSMINVENGATADQTAAEIRTLVESASDSNVFTDADHSKLNGIESGATADQTASEILTLVKTVDGSSSGLDADTVDGKHAGDFMQQGAPNSSNHYNMDNWIESNGNQGLYYPNNYNYHVYLDGQYLRIRNDQNANGIAIYTNGSSRRGYVYADNSNSIGFLNGSGGWSLKCDSSGNVTATGNVTAYSDARLKTDIHTINDALSICGKLRGVSYKWIADGKPSIGVIAQEVEEVLPEVVLTQQVLDPTGEREVKSVDYGKIVGVLINAINELKAEVDELKGGK